MTRVVLVLPVLALGACATDDGYVERGTQSATRAADLVDRRPVSEPIARNYFVLRTPEQSVIGLPQIVQTRKEDTLSDLAREYGLGYDEIVSANPGVDPWLPGENTTVLLPTQYIVPDVPRTGIVLNTASKRLFYFPEMPADQPQVVQTYPIGIGRVGWETPLGTTTVIGKAEDPAWYVPASVRREHAEAGDPLPAVVQAGPDNPLGTRVLRLGLPSYLIHGTNKPYGVGMRVSHGCVRLYPENIELLYSQADVGTKVRIINEPFLIGQLRGELYFESHEPLEDDPIDREDRLNALFEAYAPDAEDETKLTLGPEDRDQIRTIISMQSGVAIRVAQHDVYEVFARAPRIRNTVELDKGETVELEEAQVSEAELAEDTPTTETVLAEETSL